MGEIKFIPKEIVDRLHELECEDVAERIGITVRHHKALCFLHDDHNPSLGFKRNLWRCFCCGEGGDPIALVRKKDGVDFKKACVILCGLYNIPLPYNQTASFRTYAKAFSSPIRKESLNEKSCTQFDREVAESILRHTQLTDSGKSFLFDERHLSEEVVATSGIHSVDDGKKLLSSLKQIFPVGRLVEAKVINSYGSNMGFPTPALLIPYYDENNDLIGLQTRFLGALESGRNIPRFNRICNSPIRLYNLNITRQLKPHDTVMIAEGITDCLAMLSDGFHAVAIPSATSLPHRDLHKFRKYNLCMVPDPDPAGLKGFMELRSLMLRYGCEINRFDLPQGVSDYCDYHIMKWEKRR